MMVKRSRVCATCGKTLPLDRFYATGIQRSCRVCVEKQRNAKRRAGRHHSREQTRRRQLQRSVAWRVCSLRVVPEYGRPDRVIVWEPGLMGFCAYVSADACPCDEFAREGTCPHHHAAAQLLGERGEAA